MTNKRGKKYDVIEVEGHKLYLCILFGEKIFEMKEKLK